MRIREEINQLLREEDTEENNDTVDTFSPQRNGSENLKYLINEITNLKINNVRNDSNGATEIDVQAQLADDPAGIYQQKLLSSRVIGIRQEEMPVLVSPKETTIVVNNQPAMTNSTGVI